MTLESLATGSPHQIVIARLVGLVRRRRNTQSVIPGNAGDPIHVSSFLEIFAQKQAELRVDPRVKPGDDVREIGNRHPTPHRHCPDAWLTQLLPGDMTEKWVCGILVLREALMELTHDAKIDL